MAEWRSSESIRLGRFWGRRARRLLPALFCLVIVVGIHQTLVGAGGAVPGFGADGIATIFYFANWHEITSSGGYFAQTALVSPLQHTWSLAIEEQFYVIWPLLLLAALALSSRFTKGRFTLLFVMTILGTIASAAEMGVLFHAGANLNRVYYGTDTRAQALLAGSALALAMAMTRERRGARARQRRRSANLAVQAVGLVGFAAIAIAVLEVSGTSSWTYRGGFFGTDVATVALILSITAPPTQFSPNRAVLACWPLRSLGVISYGLYLWHFPLFLWLNTATTGLGGFFLLGLRLLVTLVVSMLSFFLIEQPIRQRQLPSWAIKALAPVGVSGAVAAVLVASSVASATSAPSRRPLPTATQAPNTAGTAPSCRILLPLPPPTRLYHTFHTCPPLRVLLVGDSVA